MNQRLEQGFTVVELLIAIMVIGILAAVSIVSYTGIQKRAKEVALQSDLRQASTFIDAKKNITGVFPDVNTVPKSPSTSYELTSQADTYCLTATAPGVTPYHIASDESSTKNPCPGHGFGGLAPAGENIVASINKWTLSGSASVSGDVLSLPLYTSTTHSAVTPLMRVDGAKNVTITFEMKGGADRPVWNSQYFGADKVTPIANTGGYTGNGSAQTAPNSTAWKPYSFGFTLGPNVQYLILSVQAMSGYLGGVDIRNVEVKLTR